MRRGTGSIVTADRLEVVAIGAGPAGAIAALRAADLGARTALVASGAFGGMAAADGPVPVRTLSQAARLIREARQLGRYGVSVSDPVLDYPRLLARVREVVEEVRTHSAVRRRMDDVGVTLYEHTGTARFVDPHTILTESGLRLQADKFIICTGGVSRRLSIPGFELTITHSDAWRLPSVPPSMLVVGGGDTALQIASIFNAFGTQVHVLEAAAHILPHADPEVAAAVAAGLRDSGVAVQEHFGAIESFRKTANGVRMNFSTDGRSDSVEATLAVVALDWVADTGALNLPAAGVELDQRGFVKVDESLRTTARHIFACGDVTGRLMLVPEALQDGFVAASNAVEDTIMQPGPHVSASGSFIDPEYAQVGLTEAAARQRHDVVTALVRFDSTTRAIIDGHTFGFCKLIVDRDSSKILGCHAVGERAVDIVQVAAVAMAAGMRVSDLSRIPLSFPSYAGILTSAAAGAARQLDLSVGRRVHQLEPLIGTSASEHSAAPSSAEHSAVRT